MVPVKEMTAMLIQVAPAVIIIGGNRESLFIKYHS